MEKRELMGENPQVCVACTHNFCLFHTTNKTSPTIFDKVIVHQNDLKLLYIPPVLNQTLSAMVYKKINLEDSSGKRWPVTISNVGGSLAFDEGWDLFSLEHGIKIGNFLVFISINKLDFYVMIFDETCSVKLDFSEIRSRSQCPGRGGELVRQDSTSLPISNSKPDVPKVQSQHMEVDLGGAQNGRENVSTYDYENESAQFLCKSEHDTCYITPVFQNGAALCNRDPMLEEVLLSTGKASYAPKLEISEGNILLCDTDKNLKIAHDKTSTMKLDESELHKSIMSNSNREVQERQFVENSGSNLAVISKEKHALHIGGFENTNQMFNGISNPSDPHIHIGEMKKVPMDITPNLCNVNDKLPTTGLPEVVEGEVDDRSYMLNQDNESQLETEDKFSCVVPTDNEYLKLPKCFPLRCRRGLGARPKKRMVVLLRDQLRRLWPVLYNQDKPGLNLLTAGWLDFQIANNIQPEDVCVFQVEDKSKSVVAIDIVHK